MTESNFDVTRVRCRRFRRVFPAGLGPGGDEPLGCGDVGVERVVRLVGGQPVICPPGTSMRVLGSGVQLGAQHPLNLGKRVDRGTVHLGQRAQPVRVLNPGPGAAATGPLRRATAASVSRTSAWRRPPPRAGSVCGLPKPPFVTVALEVRGSRPPGGSRRRGQCRARRPAGRRRGPRQQHDVPRSAA